MAAIASPMIAEDIAAAKAADVESPIAPVGNPLKLRKAAATVFEEMSIAPTDISFLQIPIAYILSLAVKERSAGKDKPKEKVVQLTFNYDTFVEQVTDAPADFRITDATIPDGAIAMRVLMDKKKTKKATKKVKVEKVPPAAADADAASAPSTPKKASKKVEEAPGAPVKAPKAKKEKKAKAPVMPVLTDDQLAELLNIVPPIAAKAHIKTLKEHFERLAVDTADYKQARADWIAYRASHEPASASSSLLDDAKFETLRVLDIGPRPHARNPKLTAQLKEWDITSEMEIKRATEEYKAWAKKHGVKKASKPSSKTSSPKAVAPSAIKVPDVADDEEVDDDIMGSPISDDEDACFDTALESIGDAEALETFAPKSE